MRNHPLSERQAQIAERVRRGLSDKAIAHDLGISIHTVQTHLERIAAKYPGDTPRRHRAMMLFFLNVDSDAV